MHRFDHEKSLTIFRYAPAIYYTPAAIGAGKLKEVLRSLLFRKKFLAVKNHLGRKSLQKHKCILGEAGGDGMELQNKPPY
jgi:hypothetical protein